MLSWKFHGKGLGMKPRGRNKCEGWTHPKRFGHREFGWAIVMLYFTLHPKVLLTMTSILYTALTRVKKFIAFIGAFVVNNNQTFSRSCPAMHHKCTRCCGMTSLGGSFSLQLLFQQALIVAFKFAKRCLKLRLYGQQQHLE